MDNKIIIDLRSVSKTFRVKTQDVSVLKKINLEIKKGFSIIFGPSGCGKSTLLHIILGLEPPTTGTVHFFDFNFYGFEEDERSEFRKNNIGMIYQQPNWIKSLTVLENVAFASLLLGIDKEKARIKAKEVLKMVGMIDWADYLPTELSSGQQQKVSLARALITDPKVIIADEPTGNLDYQSGIELMSLFKKLEENGKSIIMVTHNVENIDFATTVIQIFDGQVVKSIDVTKEKLAEVKKNLIKKNEVVNTPHESFSAVSNIRPFKKIKHVYPPLNFETLKKGSGIFIFNFKQTFNFVGLLVTYLLSKLFTKIGKPDFIPQKLFHFFQKKKEGTISQVDLIDISIKNILAKKTRAAITIGGMVLGIGAIVFLVSIGYGLEKLVISRVARLDEMKQIDAIPAVASNVKITDKSLSSFKDILNVKKVLPIIGVVGKINYQNSNTDVAIYGVMSDYLKESAIKPTRGKIFTSNELTLKVQSRNDPVGEVAGANTQKMEYLEKIRDVNFSIEPEKYVRVRKEPKTNSTILGYTKRVEGGSSGEEVWGGEYELEEGSDNKWIKALVLLWKEEKCDSQTQGDCEGGKHMVLRDEDNKQTQKEGYFAEVNLKIEKQLKVEEPAVLGVSTDLIEIASMEGKVQDTETKTIALKQSSKREAIVNKAFLDVLGIKENDSIGKKFNLSFVATEGLTDENKKVVSSAVEYRILGVTPDTKTPIAYVPIIDIKQLGLDNYSQVKLVITSEKDLAKVRKQIEVMGFKTSSVADTVSQIEALFKTLRLILGLLGVVALSVAALGMFNTLTVSLLERTHEIGMMKAIGMKSVEVHDLFLTESMIMGVFGGLGGLLFGIIIGKILSLILTVFAVFKGAGFIDITYVPFSFVFLIILLSLTVGIITGIYPAHRATKISALDALRYE